MAGDAQEPGAPNPAARPEDQAESLGETLLADSVVRMFGRPFIGLEIGKEGQQAVLRNQAARNPLNAQLDPAKDPRLARIYGFSYQGNYYKLAAPAVFLVHGEGVQVPASIDPVQLAISGVEFKDETFAAGVRMWVYDEYDFSVRIDIESGWIRDILLQEEMGGAGSITSGDATDRTNMVSRVDMVGRVDLVGRPGRK